MKLIDKLKFKNHPILNNLSLNFTDNNGNIYRNIVFVGENGCGKTTILKELNNYNDSKYLIDKVSEEINSEIILQDVKYQEIINVIKNGIIGSLNSVYGDGTPSLEEQLSTIVSSDYNNRNLFDKKIEEKNLQVDVSPIINLFKNERINGAILNKLSLKDLLKNVLSEVGIANIKGDDINSTNNYIDTFCSGEQELLLKIIYMISFISEETGVILIDEPETSLHPKWQLNIINIFKDILHKLISHENYQFFIATQSENILSSVLDKSDTLIIRLHRENSEIKAEYITNMARVLPTISFPEIQYIIFDIYTNDYHNQLFGYLQEKLKFDSIKKVDNYILTKKSYNQIYNRSYTYKNTIYQALPSYVRNAIHHPEDKNLRFSKDDLKISIDFLRDIIKSLP